MMERMKIKKLIIHIYIIDIIQQMDKKQVQLEMYMEYMIWQEEHGKE